MNPGQAVRAAAVALAMALAIGCSAGGGAAGAARRDGAGGAARKVPGDLLDLTSWKLQLPVGDDGAPTEVRQPELRTYAFDPYFLLAPSGAAVIFRANAGGVTTRNSKYPRAELREMAAGGARNAAWPTTSGTHAMTITQAITHLPVAKPHVVAGQVHDGSDDVVMIRLEGRRLFVEGDGQELGVLDPAYALGTSFTVRIAASGGRIRVYHDDLVTPKVDVARDATACYFKAGVYTQSNPTRGDLPDAYGEVTISALAVTHQ